MLARNKANKQAKATYVRRLKEKPCTDCGIAFHPVAMDYDHLDPTTKLDRVSQLVVDNASYERIDAEIAKCDLVCANCHRVRTWTRLGIDVSMA